MEAENAHIDKILEEVGKQVDVDIPEEMVEEQIDNMIHRFEHQLQMQGLNLDVYLKYTNSDRQALRNQMEKDAYQHVLYRLMLEEIVKLEKVEVTEEEVDKEIKTVSEKYNMSEEDFIKEFGGRDMIKYDLEMRKVIELLKEANKK